jgi:hypothetical protein
VDKKVTVSIWCTNPADSRALLEAYATRDAGEIDRALAMPVWTSPCILDTDAEDLAQAIVDAGGAAFTTTCR